MGHPVEKNYLNLHFKTLFMLLYNMYLLPKR